MKKYNVIQAWHQNTSNAGKKIVLAEDVSLVEAENALMEQIGKHDNVSVDYEKGIINDSDYSPSEIWIRGDGSLNYGDYTVIIEESE